MADQDLRAMFSKIAPGSTKRIDITLQQSDGTAIPTTALTDYELHVYENLPDVPLLKYKKTPGVGEEQINVVNAGAGTIAIVLQADFTTDHCGKKLYGRLILQNDQSANGYYDSDIGIFTEEEIELVEIGYKD